MLPRGRPPGPGTAEEKAAIRREKVRLNVKAYRERKKNALAAATKASPPPTSAANYPSPASSTLSISSGIDDTASTDQQDTEDDSNQVVIRSKPQQNSKSESALSKIPRQSSRIIWPTPNDGPIFTDAFISVFRNSFLPIDVRLPTENNHGSVSMLVTPCSPWSMSAYNLATRQEGGALKSGILAIGLILNALQNSSSELKVASLQMQRQAIVQLRNELEPITLGPQQNRSTTMIMAQYLSCLTVTMFELIQTGFSSTILKHVKALNSLIEMVYADPDVDQQMADFIIEDFGMLEMIFCLKYNVGSVLRYTRQRIAQRRRDRDPGQRASNNASVYGDILDIVDELPSLLVQFKLLQSQALTLAMAEKLQQIVRKLIRMGDELEEWNIRFEGVHGQIWVEETFLDQVSNKSGRRSRIRSYEHGAVGLFLLGFQLYAIDGNIDATAMIAQIAQMPDAKLDLPLNGSLEVPEARIQSESPSSSDLQVSVLEEPTLAPGQSSQEYLYEQLLELRTKARALAIYLLDLIDQFSYMAQNLSGQALLVAPREILKQVLAKEQIRLDKDLHALPSDAYDDRDEIKRNLKAVTEAVTKLNVLEARAAGQYSFGVTPDD